MPHLPSQLIFATVTEAALVLLSCLLVVQPDSIFAGTSQSLRRVVTYAGLVSLCLTFCWSVIFGIVITLNNLTLQS